MRTLKILQGGVLGALLLFLMSMYVKNIEVKTPDNWQPEYEQICVEDGNEQADCLCAVDFIDESDPEAGVSGERIYFETKDLLKEVCL